MATVIVVWLAAEDDVDDKEYERLTKHSLAVGGREHDEELQRHNEHLVVRNDGDVDDECADGKHAAGDGDKHVE